MTCWWNVDVDEATRRALGIILALALLAIPVSAQSFRSAGRFIARHQLLATNITLDLAIGAQTATAVYCHEAIHDCYYTPTLAAGPWQSPAKIVVANALLAAGINLGNFFWHHAFPRNQAYLLWSAPIVGFEALNASRNLGGQGDINPTNEARRRLKGD